MVKRSRRIAAGLALAMAIGIAVAPAAGANPPPAPPSGSSALAGGLAGTALSAAFDAGLPVVEATGTQKPPWYSNPTIFYRVVTDRNALSSATTKFVVLGQRPPDTFGVLPTGIAGPIATWDPRGTDPNIQWRFVNTPAAPAGVAFFSF